MIDDAAADIIAQYKKYGWELRRILVVEGTCDFDRSMIGHADVVVSDLSGLWFSRRSKPGSETWELRRLDGIPFALVAIVEDNATAQEREEILNQIELEMLASRPTVAP